MLYKMSDMDKAVTNILNVCMGLKKSESFLVVYDRNKEKIANILLKKAKKLCKKADKIKTRLGKSVVKSHRKK